MSALAALLLTACAGPREAPTPGAASRGPSMELNAVHGDFLAALWARDWSRDDGFEVCVLAPETAVEASVEEGMTSGWLQAKLPTLAADTYGNYLSENRRAHPVRPSDRRSPKLRLLSRAEAAELEARRRDDTPGEFWEAFRARYGDAVHIRLSAPGFGKDGRQALIYYVAGFDADAAWASYCLLKPKGDHWEIAAEYCAWQA